MLAHSCPDSAARLTPCVRSILVNGDFQPPLYVRQGNILEARICSPWPGGMACASPPSGPVQVTVFNDLPDDFLGSGVSIHWHGWSLRGSEWCASPGGADRHAELSPGAHVAGAQVRRDGIRCAVPHPHRRQLHLQVPGQRGRGKLPVVRCPAQAHAVPT